MKVGTKVKLKPDVARWFLETPEVYVVPGTDQLDSSFDTETQMHMLACMGVPMIGTVVREGNCDCWLVNFKIGNLKTQYYVEPKDVIRVR